jgi:hypothetical protein
MPGKTGSGSHLRIYSSISHDNLNRFPLIPEHGCKGYSETHLISILTDEPDFVNDH